MASLAGGGGCGQSALRRDGRKAPVPDKLKRPASGLNQPRTAERAKGCRRARSLFDGPPVATTRYVQLFLSCRTLAALPTSSISRTGALEEEVPGRVSWVWKTFAHFSRSGQKLPCTLAQFAITIGQLSDIRWSRHSSLCGQGSLVPSIIVGPDQPGYCPSSQEDWFVPRRSSRPVEAYRMRPCESSRIISYRSLASLHLGLGRWIEARVTQVLSNQDVLRV